MDVNPLQVRSVVWGRWEIDGGSKKCIPLCISCIISWVKMPCSKWFGIAFRAIFWRASNSSKFNYFLGLFGIEKMTLSFSGMEKKPTKIMLFQFFPWTYHPRRVHKTKNNCPEWPQADSERQEKSFHVSCQQGKAILQLSFWKSYIHMKGSVHDPPVSTFLRAFLTPQQGGSSRVLGRIYELSLHVIFLKQDWINQY